MRLTEGVVLHLLVPGLLFDKRHGTVGFDLGK